MPEPGFRIKSAERRGRILSDDDVEAIADAVIRATPCPECPVNPKKLEEAVKFYENVNEFFEGTRKTIWNTFLVSAILLILALIGLGFWGKSQGQ